MLAMTGWLMTELYANLVDSVDNLRERIDQHSVTVQQSQRQADEKLGQYMLLIEERLENLAVRVGKLEEDQS